VRKLTLTTTTSEPVEIELERRESEPAGSYLLRIGDRTAEVECESIDDSHGWLRVHGRVVPYHLLRNDRDISVWLHGRIHHVRRVDPADRAGQDSPQAVEDLTAPMPGTVLKIIVNSGQTFDAHAPLVVMESMKMEMTLSATAAGRVKEITCQEGALVEMGELLVKLEAIPGDDDAS